MRNIISALLVSAIVVLPVTSATSAFASTTDSPGGVGIQLTNVPAAAIQADPRAASYIVGAVEPGAATQSQITVTNPSSTAQTAYLYTGSATISDGVFQGDANPSTNELTGWTSISRTEIELAGGGKETVTATVTIPADAAPGERYGAVWAEVRGEPNADSSVIQASRAGIRMYVTVGGDNAAATDFTISSLTPSRTDTGLPQVNALVTNTGGRAIDATGTLMLSNGPSGLSAGPFALTQTTTVEPGSSQNAIFTLDKALPDGPWTAQVVLTSGATERSTESTLTFPKSAVKKAELPTPENLIVIGFIALGVILLAVAAITVTRSRRSANRVQ